MLFNSKYIRIPAIVCILILVYIGLRNTYIKIFTASYNYITLQKDSSGYPNNKNIHVWTRNEYSWRMNRTVCENPSIDFSGVLSSSFGEIPMSIYNPQKDIWVSRRIFHSHYFDREKLKFVTKIFQEDDTLNLIDFGCNVGVYTLTMAKMGRKVLCIVALYLNVQHVCGSIDINNFQNNIDIILNAVSSSHEEVSLGVDMKNMGGTYVDDKADFMKRVKGKTVTGKHYTKVKTVVIDDLLGLPVIYKFQRVFIKMDIEGFEARALEKADEFFKKVYIKGVLMEWIFHRGTASGKSIMNFMLRHNFEAFSLEMEKLSPSRSIWPGQDVLWLRKEY